MHIVYSSSIWFQTNHVPPFSSLHWHIQRRGQKPRLCTSIFLCTGFLSRFVLNQLKSVLDACHKTYIIYLYSSSPKISFTTCCKYLLFSHFPLHFSLPSFLSSLLPFYQILLLINALRFLFVHKCFPCGILDGSFELSGRDLYINRNVVVRMFVDVNSNTTQIGRALLGRPFYYASSTLQRLMLTALCDQNDSHDHIGIWTLSLQTTWSTVVTRTPVILPMISFIFS